MEVPIASESAHSAESGGAMKELLDRPYIDRHVGLDFFVMIIMGVVLGLLSIPYCAGVEDIPKLWLKAFGPAGFIDADLEISGHLGVGQGAPVWILLCWGFCTAVGILKAVMKLDKYPSFIDELKHQHVDPMVNLKVVICCIASLGAGAVMGLEAGLGSVGAAFGFLLWKGVEKVLPSTNETAADQRRRAYILAGLAGAFGTIFPAPVVSVILVSEIATAGTERHTPEGEFMAGRRLPKKVIFYLVPVAVSAFVMRWAETKHQTIHSYYGYGYDNLSVFLGVGLGIIAAVAVTFFLIVGAIIKAIFTMLGAPLERRLGLAARQVVMASLAGLITGVAIYLFPLAFGSGKDSMMPTMAMATDTKQQPRTIFAPELFGIAVAKVVAYWACAHGGLVGGIFYPLLYFGLTIGLICEQVFGIDGRVAVPVMIGAAPGALLPAPITALAFPVCMFVTGPSQTVPILTAVVMANAILVGTGFLEKMMGGKRS